MDPLKQSRIDELLKMRAALAHLVLLSLRSMANTLVQARPTPSCAGHGNDWVQVVSTLKALTQYIANTIHLSKGRCSAMEIANHDPILPRWYSQTRKGCRA